MPASPDGLGSRILVVDDQESNLRLLDCVLRRGGYTAVSVTAAPRDVVALHVRNHYDLIILDLQMPGMSGFDVMKAMKLAEGQTSVGILVMSADPSQMLPALAAGATSFLSKPFVLAEVLLRVQRMLGTDVPPADTIPTEAAATPAAPCDPQVQAGLTPVPAGPAARSHRPVVREGGSLSPAAPVAKSRRRRATTPRPLRVVFP